MTRTGVAISTTGDLHRLRLLHQSVKAWQAAGVDHLFVTVDGDQDAVERAAATVRGPVYQVGQPFAGMGPFIDQREGRLGVAVNKNTGLELLMKQDIDHLFLSDDDSWPLSPLALGLHTEAETPHSMVNWGKHRLRTQPIAWGWPRGSVLYAHRTAVFKVGGMVEAFGPGGHEHVEWSRRIHQHGLTETPYPAPLEYSASRGMGARAFWHAEDMPFATEPRGNLISRRRHLTSVRRRDGDWEHIEKIMKEMDGRTDFVPYRSTENGRESATLYRN